MVNGPFVPSRAGQEAGGGPSGRRRPRPGRGGGAGGLRGLDPLRSRTGWPAGSATHRLDVVEERLQPAGELERDDELRGRAGTERLQRLEVLQRHRLLVDPRRRVEDPRQRLAEALGPQDGRLALALGLEDLGLLLALGDVDRRLAGALRLGDDRAPGPLGGEHPVHRVQDVARRGDLADLDARDLAAPALGDLVELRAQDLVDLVALREHVVEEDVADDGAQGRRREAGEGARRSPARSRRS